MNKLPSRVDLDRKGIDVGSILCPLCMDDVETVNHIFFSCNMAKDLWGLYAKWWELDIPVCSNIEEWFAWIDSLHCSNKIKMLLEGVGGTLLWCIWKFRNELTFFAINLQKRRSFGTQLFLFRFFGFHLEVRIVNLVGLGGCKTLGTLLLICSFCF